MDFRIDFSEIDLVGFRQWHISVREIESVVVDPNSFHGTLSSASFILGFSDKRKFIKVAYRVAKSSNFDIEILQVELPNENDIQDYWCKKRN